MKKKFAFILAAMLTSGLLVSCGGDTESDLDYIKKQGKLVIGITEYEPMNYYDENGKLIGFDTEFAEAVCEKLGVTPNFQVIEWDMKETELEARNIDAIWNGLTITEDRKENMGFTRPYLTNRQCVVISAEDAATYTDTASLSGAIISAEGGSAGETAIKSDENLAKATYTAADTQAAALLNLKSGNVDAIVVDYTMASASVGSGDYADMVILENIQLENELYAIGFRVGSDMINEVNGIIDQFISDGTLAGIAEKYDVTDLYNEAVK